MKKSLKLKPLPPVDMNAKYALLLDSGMVKHYSIPVTRMLAEAGGMDALLAELKEQVLKDSGLAGSNIEFEMLPADGPIQITKTFAALTNDTFLALLDSETRNKFLMAKTTTQIFEWKEPVKYTGFLPFLHFVYRGMAWLENKLENWARKSLPPGFIEQQENDSDEIESLKHMVEEHLGIVDLLAPYKTPIHKFTMRMYGRFVHYMHLITERIYLRSCAPVWYLAPVFEESQIDKAMEEIANDLNIINKHFNIKGHFSKPIQIFPLMNTIGTGGHVMALLIGPVVDAMSNKDLNPTMYSHLEFYNKVKELGVKHLVQEGGVSYLESKIPYSQFLLGSSKFEGDDIIFIDEGSQPPY